MKGIILLADGFEESEALITVDLLRRGQIQIDLISMMNTKEVTSAHQIPVICDYLLNQIQIEEYQFLILPGGAAVFQHLKEMKTLQKIIDYFVTQNFLVAAICAAPILLGQWGYLKGKNYTCFKGCEQDSFLGHYLKDENVVCDGSMITAKSMYYTIDFAIAILQKLKGFQVAENILKQIQSKE